MLRQRLIPSLLVHEGRLVKGVRYADHRDAGRPNTTARAHDAQGADEIILLDIDASREGRGPDVDAIRLVAAECSAPLTVGGGIRTVEDGRACMGVGADKLCVTTTAMDTPDCIDQLARVFGSQAVVIGVDVLDVDGIPRLFDHRAGAVVKDRDPFTWAAEAIDRGAGEIRLMAVDREGSRSGMATELGRSFVERFAVPIILEGGAGTLEHVSDGLRSGVDAVAVGTMLVFSDNNLVKIRRFLAADGHRMRRT